MSTAVPSIASRKRPGSTPWTRASVSAWAAAAVSEATHELQASLRALACPADSPTTSVRAPMASSTGRAVVSASSGPEASTVRAPSAAGFLVPRTGASTSTRPCRSASSCSRRAPSGPTVAVCSHTVDESDPGRACSSTSCTDASSNSETTTTSASATASPAVAATWAPWSRSGSDLSGLRFQTVVVRPALRTDAAIPAPMAPSPITLTRMSRPYVGQRGGAE